MIGTKLFARNTPATEVRFTGVQDKVLLPLKRDRHPSERGLRRDQVKKEEDGSYSFIADASRFDELLRKKALNLPRCSQGQLARFEVGFKSEAARKLLEDLRETHVRKLKALKQLEEAEKSVHETISIQNANVEFEQVQPIRRKVRAAEEKVEEMQEFVDTCERRIRSTEEMLLSAIDDYRKREADKRHSKIERTLHEVNSLIETACKRWHQEAAPLLRELAEINPTPVPPEIYFQIPKLGDLAVRQLKTLKAYPQVVRREDGRYDFTLKELEELKS